VLFRSPKLCHEREGGTEEIEFQVKWNVEA